MHFLYSLCESSFLTLLITLNELLFMIWFVESILFNAIRATVVYKLEKKDGKKLKTNEMNKIAQNIFGPSRLNRKSEMKMHKI